MIHRSRVKFYDEHVVTRDCYADYVELIGCVAEEVARP